MLIPDIQLRAERLGAPGWAIGAILATTFLVQVPVSPLWGKLSDKVGRKPVFLICTGFSAFGMFVYGYGVGIVALLVSRAISGVGGANVAVAQALVSDETEAEARTVAMGRIGGAISLGLIGGPVLGGVVAQFGGSHEVGLVAGSLSAIGAALVAVMVRGALPPRKPEEKARKKVRFGLLAGLPTVRGLVVLAAVSWFSLATLEGTFGRLIERTLGYGQLEFGIVFGYESLLAFVVQAFVLGWLVVRFHEKGMLRTGYFMQGLGLALTPFTYLVPFSGAWFPVLLASSTVYSVGNSVANPTVNSLCSRLTPTERQGELFGLLQGTRSVGFIVGPVIGGALFDRWFAAPYLLAGATCALVSALLGKAVGERFTR